MNQKIVNKRNDIELFNKQYNKLISEGYILIKIDGPKYIMEKSEIVKSEAVEDVKPEVVKTVEAVKTIEKKPKKLNNSQIKKLNDRLKKVMNKLKTSKNLTTGLKNKLNSKALEIKSILDKGYM